MGYFSYTTRIRSFLLLLITACGSAQTLSAQTHRINCTSSAPGRASVKEVYEYDFVTVKPSFPGGSTSMLEFLNANRRYPEDAYKKGIQGRVTCQFVVNTDGSISDIQLLRGVHPDLNREAIRLLSSMPEWRPGKIEGKPVPVRVIWTVPFRM